MRPSDGQICCRPCHAAPFPLYLALYRSTLSLSTFLYMFSNSWTSVKSTKSLLPCLNCCAKCLGCVTPEGTLHVNSRAVEEGSVLEKKDAWSVTDPTVASLYICHRIVFINSCLSPGAFLWHCSSNFRAGDFIAAMNAPSFIQGDSPDVIWIEICRLSAQKTVSLHIVPESRAEILYAGLPVDRRKLLPGGQHDHTTTS